MTDVAQITNPEVMRRVEADIALEESMDAEIAGLEDGFGNSTRTRKPTKKTTATKLVDAVLRGGLLRNGDGSIKATLAPEGDGPTDKPIRWQNGKVTTYVDRDNAISRLTAYKASALEGMGTVGQLAPDADQKIKDQAVRDRIGLTKEAPAPKPKKASKPKADKPATPKASKADLRPGETWRGIVRDKKRVFGIFKVADSDGLLDPAKGKYAVVDQDTGAVVYADTRKAVDQASGVPEFPLSGNYETI
jgi:hypothetical protein